MPREKIIKRRLPGITFSREKAYLYVAIAKQLGIPRAQVEHIVRHFFGQAGVQSYIRDCRPVRIRNFGTIYFHKKRAKTVHKKRKETEEYNKRGKQRKYYYKKHGLFFNETQI